MIDVDVALTVENFHLRVAFANDEGVTALFGRSGAGKSLTLALIAGLARPARGRIVLGGRVLVDTKARVFVPMNRRRIGLVFQDSCLFPHLSVKNNLLFGRWFAPREARTVTLEQVVETLGIGHLLDRRPGLLSGGEKQRVAIGRALLSCPKLLLFDEPLASLDFERKLEILPLIERLRDEFDIPMVYVSHAMDEVARLATRVVVLEAGTVKAIGTPSEIFGTLSSLTGETRFERSSVLTMTVCGENATYGLTELKHPSGRVWLAGPAGAVGSVVHITVKATDVVLALDWPQNLSVRSVLSGQIAGIEANGPVVTIDVALDGQGHIFAEATRHALDELGLDLGASIFALVKTSALDERKVARVQPG